MMTTRRRPRAQASLRRDSRGAAMLEFGLALPLLAFLMMILVDSSRGFAAKLKLEDAAARTVEKGMAMNPPDANYEPLRQEAATASGQPLSHVTLERRLECKKNGATREEVYTTPCATDEEIARYLTISIYADYRPMFNATSLAAAYGGRGLGDVVRVTGDAQVRLQ